MIRKTGVLAPGAKEEVIRQERMASSFVHQTTTEMYAKNKKGGCMGILERKGRCEGWRAYADYMR
ncbi:MAG: hypothetical protein ACLTBB_12480, partial [Roseburia hominis]